MKKEKKNRTARRTESRKIRKATEGQKLNRFGRTLIALKVIGLDPACGYCVRVWHPIGFLIIAGAMLLSPAFALCSEGSTWKYWNHFMFYARPVWLFWTIVFALAFVGLVYVGR